MLKETAPWIDCPLHSDDPDQSIFPSVFPSDTFTAEVTSENTPEITIPPETPTEPDNPETDSNEPEFGGD